MPASSPITRHTAGRTFVVAACVLGAVAMAQFSAVGFAFYKWSRDGEVAPSAHAGLVAPTMEPQEDELEVENPLDSDSMSFPVRPQPIAVLPPERPQPQPVAEPPPESPSPAVAVTTDANGAPRPTPVPLNVFTPKADPRFHELVEQGKLLRDRGDTSGALVKLREAAGIDAENPEAYAEMAYTYEKMSLPDKAAMEWRRVLQMGERAGAYYSAAKAKLDLAMSAARGPASAGPAGGAADVPAGRTMVLGRVSMREGSAAPGEKNFTLSVPIQARRGTVASPRRDVAVHVHFYDQVNGKEIVRNNAEVSYRFATSPANWLDADEETLEVDYDSRAAGRDETRRFYGYIVRVFYKGQLQDTASEPAGLAQRFPASFSN